jgi:leader peptidase (prepilin peptidase)/N-methyltransferase
VSATSGQLLLVALFVVGLVIGSFLNVVVHRVPAGRSIVRPGSACPVCGNPVRALDNVPVVSWLLLRGRCRDCDTPIPWRYPAVELTTGVLFAAAGLRFGSTPYLGTALVLLGAGTALFLIDLDHRRLPFVITRFTAVAVVFTLGLAAVITGPGPLTTALLSTVLWVAVYGGIWLATAGRGMGFGDVMLAPVLGLALGWLGWGASLVGLMGGFVIGATVGVVLLATGRAGRRAQVPHGPFLLTGAAMAMFVGQPLWESYLRLVGAS